MTLKYENIDNSVTMPSGKALYAYLGGTKLPIGNNNSNDNVLSYYIDWNNAIVFGAAVGQMAFTTPCDGIIFFDFDVNGRKDGGAWSQIKINGKAVASGGHVFSSEVIKGTTIDMNGTDPWGYCTFVPFKKRTS